MSEEIAITDNMRLEISRAFRGPLVQIDELADVNAKMVFDYETPVGNKMARSHVHKMRGIKGEIERQRVATKAVALEFGRAVDKRAKDLVAEVDEMIAIHQKPLDAIEQREKDRQQKIQAVIDSLFRPMGAGGIADTAAAYLAEAARVEAIDVSAPICMERADEAATKKAARVADLRATATQIAQEEAARAEAERIRKEEAERLRAEEAARVERERKAAEERQRAEIERVKAEAEAEKKKAVDEAEQRAKVQAPALPSPARAGRSKSVTPVVMGGRVAELIAAAKHAAEAIHTMHSDREKGREEGEIVARTYGGQITGWIQSLEWFDRLTEAHANLLKALEPFQGGAE